MQARLQIQEGCPGLGTKFSPAERLRSGYIELLSRIVASISEDVSIIFDKFNLPAFETRIVQTISKYKKVQAIMPQDSQTEPGLQFADNICSILRHKKTTNTANEYYKLLENKIHEV